MRVELCGCGVVWVCGVGVLSNVIVELSFAANIIALEKKCDVTRQHTVQPHI